MYSISYTASNGQSHTVSVPDELGQRFNSQYSEAKTTDLVTIPTKNTMVQKRSITNVSFEFGEQPGFTKIEHKADNRPVKERLIDWLKWKNFSDMKKTKEETAEIFIGKFGESNIARVGLYITQKDFHCRNLRDFLWVCQDFVENRIRE